MSGPQTEDGQDVCAGRRPEHADAMIGLSIVSLILAIVILATIWFANESLITCQIIITVSAGLIAFFTFAIAMLPQRYSPVQVCKTWVGPLPTPKDIESQNESFQQKQKAAAAALEEERVLNFSLGVSS